MPWTMERTLNQVYLGNPHNPRYVSTLAPLPPQNMGFLTSLSLSQKRKKKKIPFHADRGEVGEWKKKKKKKGFEKYRVWEGNDRRSGGQGSSCIERGEEKS